MDQRIIELYDLYTHKPLSRAEFLKRLAVLVGSATAASALIPLLESDYKGSELALSTTEDLFVETIKYPAVNGQMEALVARHKGTGPYPAVIVIHENRGLTPHIKDVALRVARAGFLAVAPDALSVLDEKPKNEDEARQLFQKLTQADSQENFVRVFDVIKSRKDFSGKTGCVGFCWGGAMAGTLASIVSELSAAVAFYGRQPSVEMVPSIQASLQLHYASLDERVNAGIPAFVEALDKHEKSYELYMYEGVNHAFHNDTSASRYDPEAAALAWGRTIEFLRKHLKG